MSGFSLKVTGKQSSCLDLDQTSFFILFTATVML